MSDTSDTSAPAPAKATRNYPAARPKVPAFARFRGTSAWQISRVRARAYARFRAAEKLARQAQDASNP